MLPVVDIIVEAPKRIRRFRYGPEPRRGACSTCRERPPGEMVCSPMKGTSGEVGLASGQVRMTMRMLWTNYPVDPSGNAKARPTPYRGRNLYIVRL